MLKNPVRAFLMGVFPFLLLACALSTPVLVESPEPGVPRNTPTPSETILVPPTVSPELLATPSPGEPLPAARVYAVVLVPEGGTLDAHSAAGSENPLAGSLAWDSVDLQATGNAAAIGSDFWVELKLPGGGTGWVDRKYLTEYVASANFCVDGRAVSLFETLYEAARSNDGRILTSIVSPIHGLTVTYLHNGNPKGYDLEQAGTVFGSMEAVDWGLGPGSGLPVQGTFADLVRPDLLAVFGSAETHCNTIQLGGASYAVTWPSEWKNINFYSVYKPGSTGMELDWMTWLTGVEYVDGIPYLFSLSRYNWEP